MKKQIILLAAALILIFALFAFSSWTNANAVAESESVSPSIDVASVTSPLLAGLLIVSVLALLIIITLN